MTEGGLRAGQIRPVSSRQIDGPAGKSQRFSVVAEQQLRLAGKRGSARRRLHRSQQTQRLLRRGVIQGKLNQLMIGALDPGQIMKLGADAPGKPGC